jgi:hypothetical protein
MKLLKLAEGNWIDPSAPVAIRAGRTEGRGTVLKHELEICNGPAVFTIDFELDRDAMIAYADDLAARVEAARQGDPA